MPPLARLVLLPALACRADPLRSLEAVRAEGQLTLATAAVVEGYQVGWGELWLTGDDGSSWSCEARLRGSETGAGAEFGVVTLDLTVDVRDPLRADRFFARYWGAEASGGVVSPSNELRAVSLWGGRLRASAVDGAGLMAMANLTSLSLSQPGDCVEGAPEAEDSGWDSGADTGEALE